MPWTLQLAFVDSLVVKALAVEAVSLIAALAVFFIHGVWLWWTEKQAAPRLGLARAKIIQALGASRLESGEIQPFRGLSSNLQIQLIRDIAPNLNGEHLKWLATAAEKSGQAGSARSACRSKRWRKRLEGARLLSILGGDEDVLITLLNDSHPMVRTQAAEWASDYPTPKVAISLIALLEDPEGLRPFAIRDSLLRLGNDVVEPLAEYIASHSGRPVEEALEVAAGIGDHQFMEPALVLSEDDSPRVRASVAKLMGALGGNQGVETLGALLNDPEPSVRAAAARATGHLGHWPSSPALTVLLRDPTWEVRRAAGLALGALGAPGNLLLRRSLNDPDPDAADMARLVLDRPIPVAGAAIP